MGFPLILPDTDRSKLIKWKELHTPMIFLLLNVIFGSAFMLTIKWVQVRDREDIIRVGAINYIVAAIWILPEMIQVGPELDLQSPSLPPAFLTGLTMGACYFVAYFFVIHTVKRVGAASSTVVAVLSILLPIGCGVLVWGEQPNFMQVAGIGLAFVALTLMGSKPSMVENEGRNWGTALILIAFFLLAGFSRLSQEAFKHMSEPSFRPVFLMSAFMIAAIPSIIILLVRRRGMTWREWGFGFAMGAANILQSHFILKSLQYYDGFVVFPVTSAGAIVVTTLVATRVLGEHINRRTLSGIAVAVIALVLLNWTPPGR